MGCWEVAIGLHGTAAWAKCVSAVGQRGGLDSRAPTTICASNKMEIYGLSREKSKHEILTNALVLTQFRNYINFMEVGSKCKERIFLFAQKDEMIKHWQV